MGMENNGSNISNHVQTKHDGEIAAIHKGLDELVGLYDPRELPYRVANIKKAFNVLVAALVSEAASFEPAQPESKPETPIG